VSKRFEVQEDPSSKARKVFEIDEKGKARVIHTLKQVTTTKKKMPGIPGRIRAKIEKTAP